MNERTEPAGGEWAAQADPADRPMVGRGPFSRRQVRDLGSRIADYERRGTTDFYAGEYRTPRTVVCSTCRAPGEHCLCRADPDRLRYALAQISLIHQVQPDGSCSGCGSSAVLCGYLELLDHVRGTLPTPPPVGTHLPGGV
jgi:hypothetical protein